MWRRFRSRVHTSGGPGSNDVDLKELDYAVDGVLTTIGERLQISARLLDLSQLARPVWSDRFELAMNAIGDINELVTGPIVARIDPVILFIEGQQKPRETSNATALLLRAIPLMYRLNRTEYEEARRLIEQALELEPDNAMACAWAAFWEVYNFGQGWSRDVTQSLAKAQELSMKAIKLDPDNAEALTICGHICSFLHKDFDSALYYFDRALRLNPSLSFAWAMSAPTFCYIGQPEVALQRLAKYRELTPFDPYSFRTEGLYVIAYVFKGDYEQAVSIGRRVIVANPEYSNAYKPLIAGSAIWAKRTKRSRTSRSYCRSNRALRSSATVRSILSFIRKIASVTWRAYAEPAFPEA